MKVLFFIFALLGSLSLNASWPEFLEFAKAETTCDEATLEMLYKQFLSSLSKSDEPFLIAMGGSPGSGKTTFRNRNLKFDNVHLHDMDELMILFPEYQKDLMTLGAKEAFEKWWPTARELAQVLVHYAIKSGYSIIYDRTCGAEGSYQDFLKAKLHGYKIKLFGLYVPKQIAKERILKREQEEGRAITESILDEFRARFSALWPYYLNLVDEAALYETSGNKFRLIYSTEKGIQDAETYQKFLLEGSPFRDFFAEKIKNFRKQVH